MSRTAAFIFIAAVTLSTAAAQDEPSPPKKSPSTPTNANTGSEPSSNAPPGPDDDNGSPGPAPDPSTPAQTAAIEGDYFRTNLNCVGWSVVVVDWTNEKRNASYLEADVTKFTEGDSRAADPEFCKNKKNKLDANTSIVKFEANAYKQIINYFWADSGYQFALSTDQVAAALQAAAKGCPTKNALAVITCLNKHGLSQKLANYLVLDSSATANLGTDISESAPLGNITFGNYWVFGLSK